MSGFVRSYRSVPRNRCIPRYPNNLRAKPLPPRPDIDRPSAPLVYQKGSGSPPGPKRPPSPFLHSAFCILHFLCECPEMSGFVRSSHSSPRPRHQPPVPTRLTTSSIAQPTGHTGHSPLSPANVLSPIVQLPLNRRGNVQHHSHATLLLTLCSISPLAILLRKARKHPPCCLSSYRTLWLISSIRSSSANFTFTLPSRYISVLASRSIVSQTSCI